MSRAVSQGSAFQNHHHHHQSLFIHEIVSFYMVFLGIVFKTRLKYSMELFQLTIILKIQKLTLLIIRVVMGHGNNLSHELKF